MVELVLENIDIKYDDFLAVKDVDLTIKDSEIVTLLGPSGCGKTSILRAIAGFNPLSKGKILLNGEDITHLSPQKRDMGMIFQNYALWPHMTIEENIAYGLRIRKVAKETRVKKVDELLEQVQLEGQGKKYPTQLSGGQQQRVALARALAISPQVLLCDEPLSNLDFKLRVELRKEIREIAKDVGVTVVYVTHDQTEALAISDRIAVMNVGEIVQYGSPVNIFADPDTKFVANFVGENNTIHAKLSAIESSQVTVELANEDTLKVDLSNVELPIGSNVEVIVRYDELEFNPKDQSDNVIHAKLKHMAYMGTFLQVEVLLSDDTPFVMNVTDNILQIQAMEIGSQVSIKIPRKLIYLFHEGKRVRSA